jgi:tRNA pseudouridine55 synthase
VNRSGILLVDKPAGITSHDAVSRTRRAAGTRKVGHAGTLDPMATGLLVLGVNASTRLLTWVVGLDKEYFATIRLGSATTTDDAEGQPLESASPESVAAITDAQITAGLSNLTGVVQQVPSSVSAIKVDGMRAYARVREGEAVTLAARTVTIASIEVLGSRGGEAFRDVDVRVECSSGTYIRAIARDLGAALGVGGHLTALRRTRIGPFTVLDAVTELTPENVDAALLEPSMAATLLFPHWRLTAQEAIDLANGKRVAHAGPDGGPIAALAPDGGLVGLVHVGSGVAKSIVNFPKDPE